MFSISFKDKVGPVIEAAKTVHGIITGKAKWTDLIDLAAAPLKVFVQGVTPDFLDPIVGNLFDHGVSWLKGLFGSDGSSYSPDDHQLSTASVYEPPEELIGPDGDLLPMLHINPPAADFPGFYWGQFAIHGGSEKGTYAQVMDPKTGDAVGDPIKITDKVEWLENFNFEPDGPENHRLVLNAFETPELDLGAAYGQQIVWRDEDVFGPADVPQARIFHVWAEPVKHTAVQVDLDGNGTVDDIIILMGGAQPAPEGYAIKGVNIELKGVVLPSEYVKPADSDVDVIKIEDDEAEYFGTESSEFILCDDVSRMIVCRSGADTVTGGAGDDLIYGNQEADKLSGGAGDDTIFGGQGDGEPWPDASGLFRKQGGLEEIDGGEGNDLIYGNFGDELMNGGEGNDTLYGGQNEDTLSGGAGDDVLFGNRNADVLVGGTGNDVFYASANSGHDVVLDFTLGEDRIAIDGGAEYSVTDSPGGLVMDIDGGARLTLVGVDTAKVQSSEWLF